MYASVLSGDVLFPLYSLPMHSVLTHCVLKLTQPHWPHNIGHTTIQRFHSY